MIERAWIPSGQTDGPGLAITDIGRALIAELTRLSAWQHEHHSELLANSKLESAIDERAKLLRSLSA